MRYNGGWVGGAGLALFVLALYSWTSYSSIFERRPAYIYHPKSERIYSMRMGPSLNTYEPWEPFIPFHSLYYGDPDGGEYLGQLQEVLAKVEAGRRLAEADFQAWQDRQDKEMAILLEEAQNPDFEFWEIEYYTRRDLQPEDLIPDSMPTLKQHLADHPPSLLAVDAVVSKGTLKGERLDIRIIEGALVIQGEAVYTVDCNYLFRCP